MEENSLVERWGSLNRGTRRLTLTLVFAIDACLGLLMDSGSLNLIDALVLGNLPTDMVWILQTLQLICMGFSLVKIFFDDLPSGKLRSVLIASAPLFLLIHVLLSLHILLFGQGLFAPINFNLASLGTDTLTWSSTYLAIAVGCTLTYSVQRYGNFAQSEFFMLGMYVGIAFMWSDWLFPLHIAPADGTLVWSILIYTVIGAFFLTGMAGIIIDRLVFKGFRDNRSSPDVMMIASLGVALVLRAMVYLRFGANSKRLVPDMDWMIDREQNWELPSRLIRVNLGDISEACVRTRTTEGIAESLGCSFLNIEQGSTTYAFNNAFLPIISFASVFLLLIILTRTRLGRRMRAVADNPELAASSGINVERVQMISSFLSAGISGVGGAIFGITVLFSPQTAFTLLLPAFAVIVLGTIGSVPGAIVASLMIGFVRAVSSPVLMGIGNPLERSNYSALAGVMPYVIIVAILMIMPQGIGHAYDKWKIERLRKRAASPRKPDSRVSAMLGVTFGWIGAHHFHQRRSARGISMMIITVLSFSLHKVTSFMRANSFVGQQVSAAPTIPDGQSPSSYPEWVSEPSLHTEWLSLVQTEQTILSTLGVIGDIIWPLVPALLYTFALYESFLMMKGRYADPLQKPIARLNDSIDRALETARKAFGGNSSVLDSALVWYAELQDRVSTAMSSGTGGISERIRGVTSSFYERVGAAEYGRYSERGSKALFWVLLAALSLVVLWLPVPNAANALFIKSLQVSNLVLTLTIFLLLALSLNLHTGVTGLLNFGVIFFAAVGAIVVGILTAPKELYGYDWPVIPALMVAMAVGALFGWLLAYPTARLRSDYFAIITISLGEIVRILLMGEPLLRAGGNKSAIGVQRYTLPLQEWWFCGSETPIDSATGEKMSPIICATTSDMGSAAEISGEILMLGQPAPYLMLLAIIGIIGSAVIWKLLDVLYESPWGRILRSIREDEEVAQHHGHDILTHKAASLALGAAIAAFAGALWAWKMNGFQPSWMQPSKTTFYVWAAFIIGGAANNRGMLIGALIITLTDFFFNVLVAAQGSSSLPLVGLANNIDSTFAWSVQEPFQAAIILILVTLFASFFRIKSIVEASAWFSVTFIVCGLVFDQRSIDYVFPEIFGGVKTQMAHVKVMLIGLLIIFSLKFNAHGLLPEVPYRPERIREADSE